MGEVEKVRYAWRVMDDDTTAGGIIDTERKVYREVIRREKQV
jgi:hypothetical protein